jgi:hypothetical protein
VDDLGNNDEGNEYGLIFQDLFRSGEQGRHIGKEIAQTTFASTILDNEVRLGQVAKIRIGRSAVLHYQRGLSIKESPIGPALRALLFRGGKRRRCHGERPLGGCESASGSRLV